MAKLSLTDLDLKNKTVVMRVDFNVPLKNGVITDDNRIRQALPSIRHVTGAGAKLVLLSHLGRPKDERNPEFTLRPVAKHLGTFVETNVHFAEDCIGEKAAAIIEKAGMSEIVLLENVRFHAGETKNDPELSKALAAHGDVFVNDAFGSSHRAHCSVAGITTYLQPAASGFLLQKEIAYLQESIEKPKRPFVAVLGGAKVSDKIGVIENLISRVDTIIIGGGMTYTFFKALDLPVGKSLLEADKVDLAATLLEKAEKQKVEILLPVDSVIGREFKNDTESKTVGQDGIEDDWMALDIGPESAKLFVRKIEEAGTVIWNGPMGVFEMDAFAKGTFAVARAMSKATEKGAVTIIGGGDSAAAIKKAGLQEKVSHVSTGGGASLEYLEGKELPGITCLTDKA